MTPPRPLRRLTGFRRSPPGLEWKILQRLPAMLALGMLAVLAGGSVAHVVLADDRLLALAHALTAAAALLHLAATGGIALACVIVWLMKGPAYVADAYPLPDSDAPLSGARDASSVDARHSRDS